MIDDLAKTIATTLNVTEDITVGFIVEVLNDISLFDKKQRDYGSENIAAFGELGVLVRVNDKIARLKNLCNKETPQSRSVPENESIMDSWQDLSVYGVIARLVRKGEWK